MLPLPGIDLLSLQSSLRIQRDELHQARIFDPVRRKYVLASPEETVRQLWIIYLITTLEINPKLIAVERAFSMDGLEKRFDLVVFSKETHPVLLAEFKAPGIPITQSVFDQIAEYNMALQIPFSLLSNGSVHYCFQISDTEKTFIWETRLPFSGQDSSV